MPLIRSHVGRRIRVCRWLFYAELALLGVISSCDANNQDQWFVAVIQPDVGSDLAVGDTVTLSARAAAYDLSTSPSTSSTSEPARFHWTSDNPSVATVDEHGIVRALSPGETQINATFAGQHGGRTGSAALRVVVPAAALSLVAERDTVHAGDTVRAAAAAQDAQGRPVTGVLIQLYSDQQLTLVGGTSTPVPGIPEPEWGTPATVHWRTTVPGTFVIGAQRVYLRQSQTLRAERTIVVVAGP